jgi:hypothetical protein
MKNNLVVLLKQLMVVGAFFTITTVAFTQTSNTPVVRCYTDEQHAARMAEHPESEDIQAYEQWIQEELSHPDPNKIINGVYQIPVVVHVIYNGEAVGSGSNVSFAAIQSQIDVLNEDFRKMFGTNGYNTNAVGADTQIEFCLAKRRPDGSAFSASEPGVNRINRTTAGFTAPPYSTTYIDATIKTYTYNNNTPTATRGWDPAKYMNIWLCNISGGILGYAQFPESPLGGMGCGTQSAATDGVVFLYNSIGKSSVTGFAGPYNEGRTATHEIGHWLGLRHIWGDGNCTATDYCNDTPTAAAANFGCPTGLNSCTTAPDQGIDMIENYMDYTDDLCMNVFTTDQKQRMRTCLENSPRRVSLINSDACVPPNANDASVVDIQNPMGDNCAGSITPSVTLRNRGSSNLTSCTINYTVDNGAVTTFAYTGNLAPGASAVVSLPAFTSYLGTHTFKAYSTLPNAAVDPSTIYDTSSISFVVSNGIMGPYTENFDGQVFPPDLRWVVDNPNSDCYEWTIGSATSIAGVFSNNAVMMPSFSNSTGGTENLITPILTLPCGATVANIQFDVAYRRRNTTTSNYERLYVEISEDCGNTWNATPVYDKTGTTLQVPITTLTTFYTPVGTTDWRTETIDLMPFVTATSKNVKFRFRAVAANGNNIWIDNFKYNLTTGPEVKVTQATTEVLDGGGFDFGSVVTCTPTTKTFTVTNTGASTLTLTAPITITGSAFTVGTSFGTTSIAAGATTTFTVVYNPQVAGSFSETLSFVSNDCDEGTFNFLLIGAATGPGCGSTASFTATPSSVCVGQTVTVTNTSVGATTYNWNFGTGATPATATTVGPHSVTYSSAGTKTITLQINGTGSTATQTVTVNALPTTPIIAAGGPTTFCTGGSVTLTAPTSTSYSWSTGATTQSITVTTAGSYTVTVSNAAGCTATSAATVVTVNALPSTPTITAGGPTTFCTGGSVTLTAPTSTSYSWSTGATTQSITVTTAGSYTVTVSNAAGCTATSAATVVTVNTLPTTPTITAGGPTTFCTGGSVTLTAPTATSYSWSTGATTQSITVTTAGSYTVTVSNAAGCTATSVATVVTVNSLPAIPTITAGGPTTFCSGGSVTLTATSATGYSWSTGATTQSITVSTSGSYTVTVSNAAGCTRTSVPTVVTVNSSPTTPVITAGGPTTFCSGGSVTLTAPTATSYAWSTGATAQSITVTTSGSYTVTVGNASGCTATSTASVVTVNTTPVIALGTVIIPTTCAGTNGSIQVTGSGSGTLSWSGSASGNLTSISLPTTISSLGAGLYSITFTSAAGCSSNVLSSTLSGPSAPATPTITAGGPTTFCSGGSVTLTASTASGYLWSNGATTQSITATTAGSYTVTVSNAGGCAAISAPTAITVNAAPATPTITAGGPTSFCSGGSVTLTAPTASGYSWSNGATTQSITVNTAGSYTVTVSNASGCTATSAATVVTVNAAPTVPTISANGPLSFCTGGSVDLTSSLENSYLWSTGATTSSITVTTTGNYSVTVTNAAGCSATSTITSVNSNASPVQPTIAVTGPTTVCYGDHVVLTSSSSTGNVWSTGELTSMIIVTTSGNYSVTVSQGACSATSLPVAIVVDAPVIVNAGPDQAVCEGTSVTLQASGAQSYIWNNGVQDGISFVPVATYTYSVTGMSANGCQGTDQVVVVVNSSPAVNYPSQPNVCSYVNAFSLTGGIPVGGTYTGTGVSSNVFDPAVVGIGTTSVVYTYTDNNGCIGSDSSAITVDNCAAIEEMELLNWSVYPNPTSGIITIEASVGMRAMMVYDQLGKLILNQQFEGQPLEAQMDLSSLASGLYTIQLTTEVGVFQRPISINR